VIEYFTTDAGWENLTGYDQDSILRWIGNPDKMVFWQLLSTAARKFVMALVTSRITS
jgi:hypothetical protein